MYDDFVSRDDPDFIDSVEKSFRLLQAFSADEPVLTISRAAELTGLTRATARRLLLTFERLKLVESDGGAFRLTPRVLRIGHSYLASLPLWDHAQGRLRALAEEVNEACSAATLDEKEIVYVARVPAKRSHSLTLTVGSRLPAYPTSMGRVLLAALPQAAFEEYMSSTTLESLTERTITDPDRFREIIDKVRGDGYAVVDGEREEGVRSAAAPVIGRSGEVIAAMNVSVNAARISLADLKGRLLPKLREAAEDISLNIASHL
jgi:IclR family transcriptional regulator, pca regulon regulatory protein